MSTKEMIREDAYLLLLLLPRISIRGKTEKWEIYIRLDFAPRGAWETKKNRAMEQLIREKFSVYVIF